MKRKIKKNQEIAVAKVLPLSVESENVSIASTSTRRNAASTIERTDKFSNISNGLVPFNSGTGGNKSDFSIKEAVELTQKAYYNFAIFRNTIDLMTELSVSKVLFKGGSDKSKEFFQALFNKINLWSIQDKFFREYYRSGNVFLYRLDGQVRKEDMAKITQVFGAKAKGVTLPLKYVIVNPAEIQAAGSVSFSDTQFYKVLTPYELERLRKPQTEEEKAILEKLPAEVIKQIKNNSGHVQIPLDMAKITAVFYKKQDYEPFAVPMGYAVLEDINWKAEMKKMDMAITRTMQHAVLLITMGSELKDGTVNVDEKQLKAMQALFENQSVGRVLIADYTTEAKFIIPEIANLLDPKKYEQVDRDIKEGLNNFLLGGGEKFANQSLKVQVFIERLKEAREAFIREFLLPEVKRVAEDLGFKNFPMPYFEDIDLKDELEFAKIYTRLVELGVLTPEEVINAIETGQLPTTEESLTHQEEFKTYKEKGLYQPIVGGPKDAQELAEINNENKVQMQQQKIKQQAGRPAGTSAPKKKMTPIGASQLELVGEFFSASKVKENLLLSHKLDEAVKDCIQKKHNLSSLNSQQLDIVDGITNIIIANEEPDQWLAKASEYVDKPEDANVDRVSKVQEVAYDHQVGSFLAGILYASKV